MQRVDGVKSVLQETVRNEAALPVIQGDGNKPEGRCPVAGKKTGADHRLVQPAAAQQEQRQDEPEPGPAKVRVEEKGQGQQRQEPAGLLCPLCAEFPDHPDAQQSEQQREHHVLVRIQQLPAVGQVPRQLGQEREDQQIARVPPHIRRVQKALDQQEGVDRETDPADVPEKHVQVDLVAADLEHHEVIVLQQDTGGVVQKHGR